jgi:hypothetical protein
VYVERDHVGARLADGAQRSARVPRLADDLDAGELCEEVDQSRAQQLVVVRDEYFHRNARWFPGELARRLALH